MGGIPFKVPQLWGCKEEEQAYPHLQYHSLKTEAAGGGLTTISIPRVRKSTALSKSSKGPWQGCTELPNNLCNNPEDERSR